MDLRELKKRTQLSYEQFNEELYKSENLKQGFDGEEWVISFVDDYEIPESMIGDSEVFNILLRDRKAQTMNIEIKIKVKEIKT